MSERRCQALTTKGRRCRLKAVQYLIYPGDGLEYLACKQHGLEFRPAPGMRGTPPPPPDKD